VTNAYTRRLQLYRGEIGPEALLTAADKEDVQVATLADGLGKLVPPAGRDGPGAQVVRAIDPVGRLARVRIHRVGGGAPTASLRSSVRSFRFEAGHLAKGLGDKAASAAHLEAALASSRARGIEPFVRRIEVAMRSA
jgi:hypothetical protein